MTYGPQAQGVPADPSLVRLPVLSEFESTALLQVAAEASGYGTKSAGGAALSANASPEQRRAAEEREQREREEDARRRQQAQDKFAAAVNERLAEAYRSGADGAVDQADRSNFNARSITLYLVVLAVVAMPAIAMVIKLSPQTFGSYIAPVTGIAGTVVGYWFGALDRPGKRHR